MTDLPFNKVVFKTTHNSYSGGLKRSIIYQLDSNVRGIEYDVHLINMNSRHDFKLGHNKCEENVYHWEDNPNSYYLNDWLSLIKNWSKKHPGHEPITLCIDIKNKFSNSYVDTKINRLNLMIINNLRNSVYTNKELLKLNNFSSNCNEWPTVEELSGKIIVILTGEHNFKWRYMNKIPPDKQYCFVAFSLEDDSDKQYSDKMLHHSRFVNCNLKYWNWGLRQYKKGKILRIWGFNKNSNGSKTPLNPIQLIKKGLFCNFPATDCPFENWYKKAFNYYC
ncbi:MAG: hypothetical protein ACTSRP_18635 [Candidatus Helarchaeota archaeon]